MPVYNGEKYLKEAINSILGQTYKDFELIIIDDGSTDKTPVIIESYKDPRIRVIRHRNNVGVSLSRNEAIDRAKGKYIAMQDADDMSLPQRFEKQLAYLENKTRVGLVGTNYHVIDETSHVTSITTDVFTHPDDVKLAEVFYNQFGQGAVMLRRDSLGGLRYNEKTRLAEDYDFFLRLSHRCDLANIKEPLYLWRSHGKSASAKNTEEIKKHAYSVRDHEFDYFLAHKDKYKLMSLHPLSTRRGMKTYFESKNLMFRNMALMYCYVGLRRKAIPVLALGILCAPWAKQTYHQLFITLFRKTEITEIKYMFL